MTNSSPLSDDWIPRRGDVIDDRYEVEGFLDKGGMGVVMRARHARMDREVAIKFLHPRVAKKRGYRERFEREVKLATLLDHPNVVRCYDYGEIEGGVLYLVMELLEGEDLKSLLRREARFSTHRVLAIGRQILDGMAVAHAHEVIHRDIKPANIFIGEDFRGSDTVKVLDFGIAKSLEDETPHLTKTGALLGTPSYMSPEASLGLRPGKSGDIYALGLVLLEMCTGRRTVTGDTLTQMLAQHVLAPTRIPGRLWDSALGEVITRALERAPSKRYPDAEEMYEAICGAESGTPDFVLDPHELPEPNPPVEEERLRPYLAQGATDAILEGLPGPVRWGDEPAGDEPASDLPAADVETEPEAAAGWVGVVATATFVVVIGLMILAAFGGDEPAEVPRGQVATEPQSEPKGAPPAPEPRPADETPELAAGPEVADSQSDDVVPPVDEPDAGLEASKSDEGGRDQGHEPARKEPAAESRRAEKTRAVRNVRKQARPKERERKPPRDRVVRNADGLFVKPSDEETEGAKTDDAEEYNEFLLD